MLFQNFREEAAMNVDEDESGMEPPRALPTFGVEVDFGSLDDEDREVRLVPLHDSISSAKLQDGSVEKAKEFDDAIAKLTADIERMAPNMKAVER